MPKQQARRVLPAAFAVILIQPQVPPLSPKLTGSSICRGLCKSVEIVATGKAWPQCPHGISFAATASPAASARGGRGCESPHAFASRQRSRTSAPGKLVSTFNFLESRLALICLFKIAQTTRRKSSSLGCAELIFAEGTYP